MRGYYAREDGSLTLLSLLFFVLMFLIGGLAVDMLVFENNRTRLQSVSDRASLAAANLDQTADATEVVQSYFEKEGLGKYLDEVTVVDNGNVKSVEIDAQHNIKTMFMRMVGTTDLSAPAGSKAIEAVGNVEISLVLDNSGSMGTVDGEDGKSRLTKLKEAVDTFLTVMYPEGADEKVTVSVVPYSTQVNAGPLLTDILTVTDEHNYSDCIDFVDDAYSELSIDTTETFSRSGHFDMFKNTDNPWYWKCRPEASQHVYVMGSDPAKIRTRVNALIASGQTSLHLGAKWGTALLDPSMNSVVNSLIAEEDTDVLAQHSNRPVAYGQTDTVKALILMTDGINTVHKDLKPAFKDGASDLWRTKGSITDILAVNGLNDLPDVNDLIAAGLDLLEERTWYTRKVGEGEGIDLDGDGQKNEQFWTPAVKIDGVTVVPEQWTSAVLKGPGAAEPALSWPEVWADMSPINYAKRFIEEPEDDNDAYDDFMSAVFSSVNGSTKDTHLSTLCTEARAKGLTVYTVGLNVNNHSRTVLTNCASTVNFYLDANSDNLEDKFEDIAESIMNLKLRLVQ